MYITYIIQYVIHIYNYIHIIQYAYVIIYNIVIRKIFLKQKFSERYETVIYSWQPPKCLLLEAAGCFLC